MLFIVQYTVPDSVVPHTACVTCKNRGVARRYFKRNYPDRHIISVKKDKP